MHDWAQQGWTGSGKIPARYEMERTELQSISATQAGQQKDQLSARAVIRLYLSNVGSLVSI
jgi:hypothetical protein